MAKHISPLDSFCLQQLQAGATAVAPPLPVKPPARAPHPLDLRSLEVLESGMQVREERLTAVTAQRMYKLRCECGRSWFELVVPTIVHCPACHHAGLVSS